MGIGTCGWIRSSQWQLRRQESNSINCFSPLGCSGYTLRRDTHNTLHLASTTWAHHNLALKERECQLYLLVNETRGYLGFVYTHWKTHPWIKVPTPSNLAFWIISLGQSPRERASNHASVIKRCWHQIPTIPVSVFLLSFPSSFHPSSCRVEGMGSNNRDSDLPLSSPL